MPSATPTFIEFLTPSAGRRTTASHFRRIAASRPWRVAADAGIATGGGETIGLGIPGGFGSDARRGFVAASARRGLPAWARTIDEEKRDDADARDVDIAKRQAWGGHYRRHFHATSRAGMAVKIPRGLGSASKQKGGSEKAKATDADGFDAASGISRDAKSKRTDAANDVYQVTREVGQEAGGECESKMQPSANPLGGWCHVDAMKYWTQDETKMAVLPPMRRAADAALPVDERGTVIWLDEDFITKSPTSWLPMLGSEFILKGIMPIYIPGPCVNEADVNGVLGYYGAGCKTEENFASCKFTRHGADE